jgi:hypothetical protein
MLVVSIVAENAGYIVPVAAFVPRTSPELFAFGCKKEKQWPLRKVSRGRGLDESRR